MRHDSWFGNPDHTGLPTHVSSMYQFSVWVLVSDQFFWHLPKNRSNRLDRKQLKELELLSRIFASEHGPMTAETVCGIRVEYRRLTTFEVFHADKGANPEMWCPFCFGGS